MTWAWEQEDVPPNAKYVLIALADNADEDGQSWPGRRYLTRKTGIKKAETISKHLATLRELGKLTVQPQYALENGSRATNLYRLHMAPSKLGGHPPI